MPTSYTGLYVHIIFATKSRSPFIDDTWKDELHAYLAGTSQGLGGSPIIVGGVEDHVHVLVGLKATVAVADFVRELKKASSRWGAERKRGFSWQDGYGAFTAGLNEIDHLVFYISNQEEHHRTVSSEEEFRNLLREHGLPVDEEHFE